MSRKDCRSWYSSHCSLRIKGDLRSSLIRFPYARRLRFEELEDRRLLAVITVNTLFDEADGSIIDGDVSLRDAIASATSGDTINFSVTGTIDLTLGELLIDKDLTILGPGASELTIDAGNGTDDEFSTFDGFRVLHVHDGNPNNILNVEIRGVTLTGGDVPSSDNFGQGAGIRNYHENLTVMESKITGNASSLAGGGIFSSYGDLDVVDTDINGNYSILGGGGVAFIHGNADINRSTIHGNTSYQGGGVANFAIMTITNSTVSGNTATAYGGGINTSGRMTVIRSTISGNTATGGSGSPLDGYGGGIFLEDGSFFALQIFSSTITANSAVRGGGIRTSNGDTVLTNSIVAQNTASASHADICNNSGVQDFTGSYNLIGVGPNSQTSCSIDIVNGINGNLVGTVSSPISALLGPLQNNGGPTKTHALLPGSPALDAGNSTQSVDQRGESVPIDLPNVTNAVGGNSSDIGAYEAQTTFSADFLDDNIITGLDFLAWQRGFGTTSSATHADGDSDGDGDVDISDLAAWELTYGQVETTPLAAAVASEESAASSVALASAAAPVASAPEIAPAITAANDPALVDAAMAWQLANNEPSEAEAALVDKGPGISQVTTDIALSSSALTPAADSLDEDSFAARQSETEDVESEWLTDELLERVFT